MKVVAFYLPQYHPTQHNNEWWGEGFTEWTNVAKAKKLFRGHYQPKVPADLGFYDLRLPEVRQKQVELAKEAGVDGFCYYHYWFGNGKMELERPFDEVLNSGKPDFPFCLCWANESWARKMWNKDGSVSKAEVLAEQLYPGLDDYKIHFEKVLPAFKDKRYIKIADKPVFMIYRPLAFHDVSLFIKTWNKLAQENGLPGVYFIAYSTEIASEYQDIKKQGFDAVCSCRLKRHKKWGIGWFFRKILSYITHSPEKYNYKRIYPTLIGSEEILNKDIYPTLLPNWDHTPRSTVHGYVFTNSTPKFFQKHCEDVFQKISKKQEENQIVFLKSWNEWGEGNYMEPDLKYGHGYINALRNALDKFEKN
jgi:lipopolysaccharide biosynthesis protein